MHLKRKSKSKSGRNERTVSGKNDWSGPFKMSNSDFLLDKYQSLLSDALRSRRTLRYREVDQADERSMFWRHDIDVSLRQALIIAEVDSLLGVQSTFFVNVHSDTYNARSSYGRQQVDEIAAKGHHIGIHLDSEFYGHFESEADLERALVREIDIFEQIFAQRPEVFSFHNPSKDELSFSNIVYADLVNCYGRVFREEFSYVSDSNGYWRYETIEEALVRPARKPLQVLTHAEWWSTVPVAPRERLFRCLIHDSLEQLQLYDRSMNERGRNNLTESDLGAQGKEMSPNELLELMRAAQLLF